MGLVVEDGTGISGADSYNSISDLDAYMRRLGYADWPVSDSEQEEEGILARKEAAARKAALYLDSKYALRFSGMPTSPDQGLAWPRSKAIDYYGREISEHSIPQAIKNAHAEVARLAFTGTQLSPQTSAGPLLKRKKIDVLEWEYDIDSYAEAPVFGWVDQVLLPLLGPAEQVGALDVIGIERA